MQRQDIQEHENGITSWIETTENGKFAVAVATITSTFDIGSFQPDEGSTETLEEQVRRKALEELQTNLDKIFGKAGEQENQTPKE